MKSQMLLWYTLADDLANRCHTSTTRDCKTVTCRVEHEGFSFLTITLPQFGKDFERSLDRGWLDKQDFQGFTWKSGLPVFLQGFLCQVFNRSDGRLIDDPNIDAIHAVRQLTLLYSKLFLVSNKRRERAAMKGYVDCEREVRVADTALTPELRKQFRRVSNTVFGRAFRDLDIIFQDTSCLKPKHGPGATADGKIGNQKWQQESWPIRLEKVFRCSDYLLPCYSYFEELETVDFLEPEAEIPVKVLSVPKTQKTPRIIAKEPTAMMYTQQAIRREIYARIDGDDILSALVGFSDQTPNQRLAEIGSSSGTLATLDLSEASDRVSYQHVRELLALTPSFWEVVDATRSLKADVPGHGVIPLAKFASMGSALSFPMEAMVFLSLIFMGIENTLNRPLTYQDVKSYVGKVRVFGDDLIVPEDTVVSVIECLEAFGLRVNHSKSFWTGKFRESCGKEYYDGHDVSIVKVRQMAPTSRKDAQEVISWVSTSNQFYRAGLWKTTKWLDSFMSGILKDYPVVEESSPVLGRHSFMGYEAQKVGGRFQVPLVRGYVERAVIPVNKLDDYHAMHKWFLLRGDLPLADEDHLERSGRPFAVDIKRRWAKPY